MRILWENHGLAYFNFRDDTFTTNKARVLNFCEEIESSGMYPLWGCQSRTDLIDEERLVAMARAGCEFIQFGVEHGSEEMLKALGKDADLELVYSALSAVRKVGVTFGIYLITGIPGETMEDVAKSEALIDRVLPHDVQISPLAVYPGTRLYSGLIASGAIQPDFYSKSKDIEVFARKHDEPIFTKVGDDKGRCTLMRVLNDVMIGNERAYVDGHTGEALERLRLASENVRERARYTPEEFRQQKRFLGWCATTNILCGEAAEDVGDFEEASAQYTEVIQREPDNPWGWLKRGSMRINQGQYGTAADDMREVLKLMPNNYDAIDALEYLARRKPKKKK
jgi:tetratricopeptide (TPR) repeat protein